MIRLSPSQSTVNFPSSSSNHSHVRPPHLPFRRISFPTSTSILKRQSVASVSSFDSLPEEVGGEAADAPFPVSLSATTHLTPISCQHKSSLTSSSTSLIPASPRRSRRISIESPQSRRHKEGRKTKQSSAAADASIASNVTIDSASVREAREQRKRKIIHEFYDTEKTYVDGLDFIYHHFLSPLIASLETSEPLLDRAALTNLFSNFIDIWNLHKAFFEVLTEYLSPMPLSATVLGTADPAISQPPLPLSPILLSHFPYLSLYNPFITAFPSILSALASLTSPPSFSHPNPNYSKPFSEFLLKQESDPQCGKLKFRDWMLTIVQRCPRYLLLLKDLRRCTEPTGGDEEGEYEKLGRVLDLVSKITSSLNTSLQTHAETLSLISLQRSTTNLPLSPPFQFVLPGRKLLKRGPLYQIERSEPPREREFLLFSDCLVWLARKWGSGELEDALGEWRGRISSKIIGSSESVADANAKPFYGNRNRCMSEAHLPLASSAVRSTPPPSPRGMRFPLVSKPKRHSMAGIPSATNGGNGNGGGGMDERWVYKGRLDLVDVEVVVSSEWGGEQRRFEVLSPEGSFALYAATEHDRDEWVGKIRQAKAQLLVSLNVTNPNSTLTSSASTYHVRRSLQALPFPPAASSVSLVEGKNPGRAKVENLNETSGRRRKVDHWVPAIWIPDEKTRECMRCGQGFGWRRRRHHCRLCGRCVCGGCSEKTFYITDAGDDDSSSKPARACNVCYETVFPVLDPEAEYGRDQNDSDLNRNSNDEVNSHNWDTITSLSNFAAWLSTPSFSVQASGTDSAPSSPRALMGMDFERTSGARMGEVPLVDGRKGRLRLKSLNGKGPNPRPSSSLHVLEGFGEGAEGVVRDESSTGSHDQNGCQGRREQLLNSPTPGATVPIGVDERSRQQEQVQQEQHTSAKPVESTVKRKKRFSLPAIALQPLNVTARTVPMGSGSGTTEGSSSGGMVAKERERTRRFSLVLGGRYQSRSSLSLPLSEGDNDRRGEDNDRKASGTGTGEKSVVIMKLRELLKSSSSRTRMG